MTLLPIVTRELLVAARRPPTYRSRAASAGLALGLGAFLYANAPMSAAQLGEMLFAALSFLALLSCLLSGARHTAECISAERRDQTLGLLFLTDLRSYDVTLGKLVAGLVPSIQGLLAIVPVIAVPILIGGVSGLQVVRVVVVLLLTMFYSLTLGLWISTWFERGRRAAGLTAGLMLALALGPYFIAGVWTSVNQSQPPEIMFIASPVYAQWVALAGSGTGILRPHFGVALLLLIVPAWLFLWLATRRLPRLIRDRAETRRRSDRRAAGGPRARGHSAAAVAYRRQWLDRNPFCWLAARDRRAPLRVWAVLGFLVVGAAVFAALFPTGDSGLEDGRYFMLSIALHLMLRVWIVNAVTARLGEDRVSGALELLLSTPLTPAEVVQGQWLALRRQFLGPVLGVLALDAWICTAILRDVPADAKLAAAAYGCRAIILLADIWALGWTGIWQALQGRGPTQAATNTFARVFVAPWLMLMGLVWGVNLFTSPLNWNVDEPAWIFLLTWFVLGLTTDIALALWHARQLRTRLRGAALEPIMPARGWRRWWPWRATRAAVRP